MLLQFEENVTNMTFIDIIALTIIRDLTETGGEWEQVQVYAKAIGDVTEKQHQDVVTKDFVTSQIKTIRTEASDLCSETKAQDARLLRWKIGPLSLSGGPFSPC